MRVFGAFLFLCTFLIPANLCAQREPGTAPAARPNGTRQYYVQDGGVTETLQSIVIPPKAGAPFTLTLQTEWVKILYDGGTITSVNQRRIARDSKGRIYQERWFLVPKNGKADSQMTTIQISDPSAHTLYNCFMLEEPKQCVLTQYTASTSDVYKEASPPPGDLKGGQGTALHEDLGKQSIDGIETTGTKDSMIYNPGVFGNDRKVAVEREFWYSAELGLNLLSIRSDPRIGKQTFRATNVILSEPDAKLFELPEGFEVQDRRPPSTPAKTN
ncbi:MAG: hypothetical protein WBL63_10075 [Candidatus Acidiferrum sp.]